MNDRNWEETGLLRGLSDKRKSIVEKFLRQMDLNLLTEGQSLTAPVIRCIISNILNWSEQGTVYNLTRYVKSDDDAKILLEMVDVDRIARETDLMYVSGLIPLFEMHFYHGSMDVEAEFARLYAQSYMGGLVKRYKEEKDRLFLHLQNAR